MESKGKQQRNKQMTNNNAPLYNATSQAIAGLKQSMLNAIDTRCQFEEKTTNSKQTIKQLGNIAKKIERMDYRASAYILAKDLDFDGFVNSSKQHGTRANIYSIPKYLELCTILNNSDFFDMSGSDHATICASIVALHKEYNVQKTFSFFVNDIMSTIRNFQALNGDSKHAKKLENLQLFGRAYRYANGATQGGSSLRALEALGIVREVMRDGSCKVWTFANDDEATRELIKRAYKALSKNMPQDENDSRKVRGSLLSFGVPETVFVEVLRSPIEEQAEKQKEEQQAQEAQEQSDSAYDSALLAVADSDGMSQMHAVSVPAKKQKATSKKTTPKKAESKAPAGNSVPFNIFDKEAMAAEMERQAKQKREIANAKRKATLAKKKAAQATLAV